MTKNITLAVDADVLRRVRKYAAERDTSVNALVREALQQIADRVEVRQQDWDELFELADKSGAEVGPITWTRDDLYER